MIKSRRYLIGCPIVPLILIAGGGLWVTYELEPVSRSQRPVFLTVRSGEGAARIAKDLRRRGLIRNERIFLWYAARHTDLAKLKAGQYRLSPNMSAGQILDRLKRGSSDSSEISVTIPEGFTVAQIAHTLVDKAVITDEQEFVRIARQPSHRIAASFRLPKTGLEGYLYPDTYRFLPRTPPDKVMQTMLAGFEERFYKPHRQQIERSRHSLSQLVTIASLIEREAEVPQDRPKIAGVIENRLRRGMRLEIDATLDYAHGHHLNRVLYKDLEIKSPYNTYRHKGLPPGPIANPGLASLDAALAPEHHNFLYYVAGSNGAHIFSVTESEHRRNVARVRSTRATGG